MRILISALLILLHFSYVSAQEVRGVWLTTNSGLDWPGNCYTEKAQKEKLVSILDKLEKAHFNLVLFQVQANGDVMWNSKIQPTMSEVTGDGSRQLSYDVCSFVIEECHKRNMKCHAWVVPYRLGSLRKPTVYAGNKVKHVAQLHPEMCVKYSNAYYLDPGLPETRSYLVNLYRELLEKYAFDGINLDYTRYPGNTFPDDKSFKKYNPDNMSKDDWRRSNINEFVTELYAMAKSVRPNIVVGSAPIGTYKNVASYKNATAYDTFQQDPGAWISSHKHDMIIPQMYWNEDYGFSEHINTWVNIASGVTVVVGLAPYKIRDAKWSADTVIEQIEKAEKKPGVSGVCFFRAEHVLADDAEIKRLYEYLVNHPPMQSAVTMHEGEISSMSKFLD